MDRREFRVQICPLLSALESCSSIRQALQIHAQLLITGLHRRRLPLSKLISFLALSGPSGLRHSHLLFSQLKQPNIFIYNCMIRGYAGSGSPVESVSIYKDVLREGKTKPNDFTFPFLLKACSRLRAEELGLQVHCHVKRSGFDSNFSIKNSLLHFYTSFKEVAHVRSLFDEITHLDVASFNIVISCCARCGQAYEASELFRRMLNSGMKPDGFTFAALLSVCLVSGDVRIGRAIHLLALKSLEKDYADNHVKSALVDMYVRLGRLREARYVLESIDDEKHTKAWSCMVSGYARSGDVEVARKLFDEMPEKDLISWTAMISGYSQTGKYKEALELFAEMEKLGFRPDEVSIVAMLPVCSKLGALHLGKRLHHYAQEQLLSDNGILTAALVDMYAKCGCISTALDIFSQVDERLKNLSLFNSMISGLAQHRLGERALAVFKEMEELEVIPDEITFVGVLCACSHSGLMEEGRHMFDKMQVKYGIVPQIEHFGCMVDLLGRMGLLHEAYDLIQGMPMKANSVIWSSLLRSCRIHKNAEIGKLAKKRILQLNGSPETGCRLFLRYLQSNRGTRILKN